MEIRKTSYVDTIKGNKFQFDKFDARTACWMYSFLLARSSGNLSTALGQCSRKEFDDILSIALKQVSYLDSSDAGVFPIAIIAPNGLWSKPEFNSDPELIMALTLASITFNLQPFLAASGSNSPTSTQPTPDGSQQNT